MKVRNVVDTLERLTPEDLSRVILRIPKARNYVVEGEPHIKRVNDLVDYCASAGGPGMDSLSGALGEVIRSAQTAFYGSSAKKVFIVYGRNSGAYTAMVLFIRALGLEPLSFEEVRNDLGGSPFVGNIVRRGMELARAIVVLFTPDEVALLGRSYRLDNDCSGDLVRFQARANVLIEAGMALGMDESRTILVVMGEVDLPSDLRGRHYIQISNHESARTKLRDALIGAGCDMPVSAPAYANPKLVGDFDSALAAEHDINAVVREWCEANWPSGTSQANEI